MLMVFQRGTSLVPNSTVSITNRTEGRGGHIKVFWAANSFNMSFWIVPPSLFLGIPLFSAMAMYMAQITEAGGLMVMEVVIRSMGKPSKRISISFRVSMATPHFPHSPLAMGESRVVTHQGGHIKGGGKSGLTLLH